MKKEISVVAIDVSPAHELIISAACSYYDTTRGELFSVSRSREHSRRKGVVFYIIKEECQMTAKDVADICNTSRQNAAHAINSAEGQTKVYLPSICDYRNIKSIYSDLLSKQEQWLSQHLPSNNTRP